MAEQEQIEQQLQESQKRYIEQHRIGNMMQGMLSDLLIAQPEDPLEFLVTHLSRGDSRDAAAQEKLLQEVYDEYFQVTNNSATELIMQEVIVLLSRKGAIVSRFPHHTSKLAALFVELDRENSGKPVQWEQFRDGALKTIARPGGEY
jgi:hypothetical protein